MAAEEVSVIALVENLELAVPRRPPARFARQPGLPAATRVVELALKRQINAEAERSVASKTNGSAESAEHRQGLEILRRLPPGTLLIKQVEANATKDTEEEERATSEETGSERPRKMSQRIRNKKPLEVRRNPLRSASRKDPPTKDGRSTAPPPPATTTTTTRQRLLAAKRRGAGNPADSASGSGAKRTRSTPYMNTRSVTRKLYNVGATYEAPTTRDETQWKEWPVHGMHERPVYHPQFGLAAEYNGRLFASFDGEGYREITPEAHQIEIVRVDPRVDSLDGSLQYRSSPAIRPKLLATTAITAAHSKTDKPRLANFYGYVRPFEHLQTSFSLSPQQQQQLRNLERLQHLENLQRLGSRVRLQSPEGCQAKLAAGRFLSKEMFRSLQSATLAHAQQSPAATAAPSQANPSKCLIVPRGAAAPITLPFCGVQTFKNPKGKLFFVRASDAPKKPSTEKSSTITSSGQSQSLGGASWAESSLRKRLEGPPIEAARLFVPSSQQKPRQPATRGFPPIRLAESTGIFRPKTPRDLSNQADFAPRASPADDGHMPEVLDLSKKEPPKLPDVKPKIEKIDSPTYTTDLVRYFQNFGADESMDLFDDSKNLT